MAVLFPTTEDKRRRLEDRHVHRATQEAKNVYVLRRQGVAKGVKLLGGFWTSMTVIRDSVLPDKVPHDEQDTTRDTKNLNFCVTYWRDQS